MLAKKKCDYWKKTEYWKPVCISFYHHHRSMYTFHCRAHASSENGRAWSVLPTRTKLQKALLNIISIVSSTIWIILFPKNIMLDVVVSRLYFAVNFELGSEVGNINSRDRNLLHCNRKLSTCQSTCKWCAYNL